MAAFKRVSLKLSGEALGYDDAARARTGALDFAKIEAVAEQLAAIREEGIELGVTLGGGNIWRGRSGGADRSRADHMGMLATLINALGMQDVLEKRGVPCTVLSALNAPLAAESYSPRAAKAAFEAGHIVIFAGGSGCPFFSTDTAAALKACEIGADALLLAKNIDYVYSADPRKDKNAVAYTHLSYDEVVGRKLQATDLTAITLCRENAIPIVAFGLAGEGNLLRAARGEAVGTRIDAACTGGTAARLD